MSLASQNGYTLKTLLYGQLCIPYEEWLKNFDRKHFISLVEEGIIPLLQYNNYYITINKNELAQRISYWAWEVFASAKTLNRMQITSLKRVGEYKTRSQYEKYCYTISTSDWNDIFDEWQDDYLFNTINVGGSQQRNTLPDFLWKLIQDENGYSDEEDDDDYPVEKSKGSSIHELGWVTNNRRNF